jgi:hypothetical protein
MKVYPDPGNMEIDWKARHDALAERLADAREVANSAEARLAEVAKLPDLWDSLYDERPTGEYRGMSECAEQLRKLLTSDSA